MQKIYHSNAATNINIRRHIKENNSSSNKELAQRFATLAPTVLPKYILPTCNGGNPALPVH